MLSIIALKNYFFLLTIEYT